MLEPREADIPALFLVLVVFPLVTYILLGKWNEAAKKKERIDLLAQLAAEEALHAAEAMATASVVFPVDISPKPSFHPCARCFGPATTRCSRCKSVRYCSGKCQIVHWRHGHKQECQLLEMASSNLYSKPPSFEGSFDEGISPSENLNSWAYTSDDKHTMHNNAPFYRSHLHPPAAAPLTASMSRSNRELPNTEEALFGFVAESPKDRATNSALPFPNPAKSATLRHEIVNDDSVASAEEIPRRHSTSSRPASGRERTGPRSSAMRESHKLSGQTRHILEPSTDGSTSTAVYLDPNGRNASDIKMGNNPSRCSFPEEGPSCNNVRVESSTKKISGKGNKSKSKSHSTEPQTSASSKPVPEGEGQNPRADKRGCLANELKISQVSVSTAVSAQGINSVWEMGGMRIPGLRKLSKVHKQDPAGVTIDGHNKMKVLFPYEEFVKCFCCEVLNLSPRGLLNCGNSCYANAVLQCLTCTKPLTIYLLCRLHSRHCRKKNWCLMCELEQHVMMLREGGGPLSPNRILSHMQSIGCQMGSGSQEDAHEFLRLLVTSMQSICLEGLGVEKEVDPRLQETTFIQHIFGGRLRSKVKCPRCQHESERYENIMDLTLEILGWVARCTHSVHGL